MDIDLERTPFCYWCLAEVNLSIKARRKTCVTYICKACRNIQSSKYKKQYQERPLPPKRIRNIGWTKAWLNEAKQSMERISKKYGVTGE